ncbi:ROK family protein [Amnibacterium flavum]|uniref:ROK family protein n=1 Tax=Amnibacterium flavum TaxID=2173173 RepID=UPI0014033256|nr:ROK family protein [Amnibacterium flavum]
MRIGIDVGGTKARAVALDAAGVVLAHSELPSGRGADEVLATVRTTIERLAAASPDPVESVGIGIPGTIDFDRGVVSHAVNLGIDELDLAAGIADLEVGRVSVDNDVNAAALGAFQLLGGGVSSLAYLNVGTGIAAGLVLGGELWHGFRGVSGEVGHLGGYGDLLCPCGQIGCLETIASGAGLARSTLGTTHPVISLTAAVAADDPIAIEILARVAGGVADAAETLFLVVGVDLVVLGGGVVHGTPQLAPAVGRILDERAAASPFLASLSLSERLTVAPVDLDIAAMGAAFL